MSEGEEKEQEIGNLLEKIMKENFPYLVKEIDMQVQEAQRVPNKMDPKRTTTPKHIIIKMPNLKIKREPWLVQLSGLSAGLRTKALLVRFPVRAHAWVVGQVPGWGCTEKQMQMGIKRSKSSRK